MSKSSNGTAKGIAIGALVAGAAGYIAGLLTAPKSGKETRNDIKEGVSKGLAEAEKELKKLNTQLNEIIDDAKQRSARLNDAAREELTGLVSKAKDAKEKVREMLSAIHEGDSQDTDLQQAIKEASAALDHLREYLKR